MGRRAALLACLIGLVLTALSPGTARSGVHSRTSLSALDVGLLAELNNVRTANGLAPLKVSPELTAAARQHSSEMLAVGYFEHESAGGLPFWKRIQRFYAEARYGSWSVGENLLWSAPDVVPKKAIAVWMASPAHRENILKPSWREIGIAAVQADAAPGTYGGRAVTVITTDFGARR